MREQIGKRNAVAASTVAGTEMFQMSYVASGGSDGVNLGACSNNGGDVEDLLMSQDSRANQKLLLRSTSGEKCNLPKGG